jgi:hypothetical protein
MCSQHHGASRVECQRDIPQEHMTEALLTVELLTMLNGTTYYGRVADVWLNGTAYNGTPCLLWQSGRCVRYSGG